MSITTFDNRTRGIILTRMEKTRKDAVIGIRTTPEVKAAAEAIANRDGRSLSQWIERLICAALAKVK